MKLKVLGLQGKEHEKVSVVSKTDFPTLREGSAILIEGKRQTVTYASVKNDIESGVIMVSSLARRNIGVDIGDYVAVTPVSLSAAQEVFLAPTSVSPNVIELVKPALLGQALIKDDVLIIPLRGTFLELVVVFTKPEGAVKVTDSTAIKMLEKPVRPINYEVTGVTFEDVGGLEDVKQRLKEIIILPILHPEIFESLRIKPPRGVLLTGPPGCGKTLLAKAVATEARANFFTINGPEFISQYVGESERRLREVFEEAEKKAPAVIFIDEIDAIAGKRADANQYEVRLVSQLLTLMDGFKKRDVVVIAATNRPDALDEALRRPGRFDWEIQIGIPNADEREKILRTLTREKPLGEDVEIREIAELTNGYTGADLALLLRESTLNAIRRMENEIEGFQGELDKGFLRRIVLTREDFMTALNKVVPSGLREVHVEIPRVRWEDVGGLDDVKRTLEEEVGWQFERPQDLREMGITPVKGIILYGPKGNGKTLLARALAGRYRVSFIPVRGPELLSKWVGESEKKVREIFEKARKHAPSIIFFDEIDSIARPRGFTVGSDVGDRIVGQLLVEMDGIVPTNGVLVLAATNRIDLVDPDLMRPGRFEKCIHVPPPDKEARRQILAIHLRGRPLDEDVDIEKLAEVSEGFSGADISSWCNETAKLVLRKEGPRKIKMKDFLEALEELKQLRYNVDKVHAPLIMRG